MKMKKIILLVVVIIFNLSIVNAADLLDYPDIYASKDLLIVVGDKSTASNVLAQSSISSSLAGVAIVKNKLSSEVSGLNQNIISVGTPCVNPVSAQIMSNPQPCDKDFKQGKAYIKLYNTNGFYHIVVAGYSDAGTRKAANALANYKDYQFSGSDYEINMEGETEEQAASTVGSPSQKTESGNPNQNSATLNSTTKITSDDAMISSSGNLKINEPTNSGTDKQNAKEDKTNTKVNATQDVNNNGENPIIRFFRWIFSWFR